MNRLPRHDTRTVSAIGWLLVVAVLFATLMPMHYHLSHGNGPSEATATGIEHKVDLHPAVDTVDVNHHQDAHTIDVVSDATVKVKLLPLALVTLLLTLLVLMPARSAHIRRTRADAPRPRHHWQTTPPLRAPPCA